MTTTAPHPDWQYLNDALVDAFSKLAKAADQLRVQLGEFFEQLAFEPLRYVERLAIEDHDIPESDIDRVEMRDGQWGVRLKNWRWVPIELP